MAPSHADVRHVHALEIELANYEPVRMHAIMHDGAPCAIAIDVMLRQSEIAVLRAVPRTRRCVVSSLARPITVRPSPGERHRITRACSRIVVRKCPHSVATQLAVAPSGPRSACESHVRDRDPRRGCAT